MTDLQILRRCAGIEEALVLESALRAGGFRPLVSEFYTAANTWDRIAAYGGIAVRVPAGELSDAADYLLTLRRSAREELQEQFGDVDWSPLPRPWRRALSMLVLHFKGGIVFWFALAALLSILPIDWYALVEQTSWSGSLFIGPTQARIIQPASVEYANGLFLLLLIVALLVFELWDVFETKHNPSHDET
ncbi:MAG: hypothetical protein AAGJ29_09565 [Pseudomonadota bacterium]